MAGLGRSEPVRCNLCAAMLEDIPKLAKHLAYHIYLGEQRIAWPGRTAIREAFHAGWDAGNSFGFDERGKAAGTSFRQLQQRAAMIGVIPPDETEGG